MRRLLVTGGAGFIGTNFVHHWMEKHPEDPIIVLDKLTYAGRRENLAAHEGKKTFTFVHGDICDKTLVNALFQKYNPTHIVHFAAESHVDRSISESDVFIETNIKGTHTLLEVAKEAWKPFLSHENPPVRFHHVSTDEVFGSLGTEDPPFHEHSLYAPSSPYSASKAASDHLVRAYHKTYGLPITLSYCSNNYGPYQFPEKLIPLALSRLLRGEKIPIYGSGENRRDWLYVRDHCLAIEAILEKGVSGECYCIGGGEEFANRDLVQELCRLADRLLQEDPRFKRIFPSSPLWRGIPSESLIFFVPDRPGHDLRYAMDATKMKTLLGWYPETSFHQGLQETVFWFLNNKGFFNASKEVHPAYHPSFVR